MKQLTEELFFLKYYIVQLVLLSSKSQTKLWIGLSDCKKSEKDYYNQPKSLRNCGLMTILSQKKSKAAIFIFKCLEGPSIPNFATYIDIMDHKYDTRIFSQKPLIRPVSAVFQFLHILQNLRNFTYCDFNLFLFKHVHLLFSNLLQPFCILIVFHLFTPDVAAKPLSFLFFSCKIHLFFSVELRIQSALICLKQSVLAKLLRSVFLSFDL